MRNNKYCYVIAHQETGELLVNSGTLPFYWKRDVAKDVCKGFKNYVVHKIELSKIEDLVLSSKSIKN